MVLDGIGVCHVGWDGEELVGQVPIFLVHVSGDEKWNGMDDLF